MKRKIFTFLAVLMFIAPLGAAADIGGIDQELNLQQGGADGGQASGEPSNSAFQIVPCNGAPTYQKDASGKVIYDKDGKPLVDTTKSKECDFNQLVIMVNRIIKFLLYLSIPMILGMILYTGYTYLTANGNPSKLASAKKMLIPIALGLFWILAAYILVYTVLDTFLADSIGGVAKKDIIYLNVKK